MIGGFGRHIPRNLSLSCLGLAISIVAFGGCRSDRGVLGCSDHDDCPAGFLCQADQCQQVCDNDNECAVGKICVDSACVEGRREAPQITDVQGNSSQACVLSEEQDATSPAGPCLGDGFVVTGSNLQGAAFSLTGGPGAGQTYAMTVRTGTAQQVEVVPQNPGAVQPGTYKLIATNQSGGDEQSVKLLRGEPGAQGEPGGSQLYFVQNQDAPVVTQKSGDKLHIRITGNATNKRVDIDHAKFVELCGDEDGCTITVGVTQYPTEYDNGDNEYKYFIPSVYAGSPCRFYLRNGTHWATSSTCSRKYLVEPSGGGDAIVFVPYFSGVYGQDGMVNDFPVVLNFERLCILSDAPPNFGASPREFQNDTAPGFHFFMVDDVSWAGSDPSEDVAEFMNAWLDRPTRTCELTIED